MPPAPEPVAPSNTPPLREKASYALGDFGLNLYWSSISAFLLIFYTDVMLLPAAAVGTLILVTKIGDAIADPLMGMLADRTRTRWGHFRPWLLWGALPLAATGVLAFTVPPLAADMRLLWAYATFSLMMLAYTVVSIPYSALSGVITADGQQRTVLVSMRFIAAFAGTTFVNYATLDLVGALGQGDAATGWQRTLMVYGALAAVLFASVFFGVRERVVPSASQRTPWRQDVADLLHNRPWLVLFVLALVIMVTIVMRAGAGVYYFKYYLGRPDLTGWFLGSYSVALALGAAATPLLTRWFDRRRLMIGLMCIVGVLSASMYFVPPGGLVTAFVLNILVGLALGPKSPLAFAMYADTADYTEWRTGRRATALTFAAATFSQKLGGAIASAAIAWVLAGMGYVANQSQSQASQHGIVLLMTVIPGMVALLAAWTMRFYPLDEARLAEIQQALAARRATPEAST